MTEATPLSSTDHEARASGPSFTPAPAVGWIDSHCHLQDRYRPEGTDLPDAIDEAVGNGVRGLVCVGTDAETSRQAVDLASSARSLRPDFGCWATVGLHPHEASHGLAEVDALTARVMCDSPSVVVAVGECGLDYHYDHSPRPVQRTVFEAQAARAVELDLALVVHCRDAWDDTIAVLRDAGPPPRTVLHCFTGGPDEARRCLDLGAYLSFSGIVTFKGAQDVRDAAAICPSDKLLVETDAPFLAPVPHRGQQNRPAWVAYIGDAVAAIRECTPETLAESSAQATRAVFTLD